MKWKQREADVVVELVNGCPGETCQVVVSRCAVPHHNVAGQPAETRIATVERIFLDGITQENPNCRFLERDAILIWLELLPGYLQGLRTDRPGVDTFQQLERLKGRLIEGLRGEQMPHFGNAHRRLVVFRLCGIRHAKCLPQPLESLYQTIQILRLPFRHIWLSDNSPIDRIGGYMLEL